MDRGAVGRRSGLPCRQRTTCESTEDGRERGRVQRYLAVPPSHWKRLRTNDVQERTNRKIKRRSRIVQAFPSEKLLERPVGAVTCERDELRSESRYFAYGKIQELHVDEVRRMILASIDLAERVEAA